MTPGGRKPPHHPYLNLCGHTPINGATSCVNYIGKTMSQCSVIGGLPLPHSNSRPPHINPRHRARIVYLLAVLLVAMAPLFAFTTTAAKACACGCSVFDVGGGLLPQENDHGGRVFIEWWHADQNQNWIGSSKGSAAANSDKRLVTDWYTAGFMYMFNREWGVMARLPYVNRSFTTDTGPPGGIQTFNSRDFGDLEVTGMYTGFSQDLSTGVMFGLKLPTGVYTAQGLDRDTQIGSGSTDLILGAFHRGLITGDNAWQYFTQIRWQQPFLYRGAVNPDTGLVELYKPSYQVDGAAGVLYNNLYNVLGFDKITPLVQIIASHRGHDRGEAADPFNSGFDRLMFSPGIEFTKVLDEANNRVLKVYFDVEIPFYYRTNASVNDAGSEGQLIAPYLFKLITSYNF
jgi:hypothetical protein